MKRKILPVLLALLVLLPGCSGRRSNDSDTSPSPSADVLLPSYSAIKKVDNIITTHYDAEAGFNPFTVQVPTNFYLASLMYEGLFALDKSFEAQPVLCESYETKDGTSYTIKLKENIIMSDGSYLDVNDVVYSLDCAAASSRFSERMSSISSYYAGSEDYTLIINLSSENYKLPELLDIPIIKYGYIDSWCPPGTGPYRYSSADEPHFYATSEYRDEKNVPVKEIYLKKFTELDMIERFTDGTLDLIWEDPCDSLLNIRSGHDEYVYTSTTLQYLGFNGKNSILSNTAVRQALGYAVNRNAIIRSTGVRALAAPLIFPSTYGLYDKSLENSVSTLDGITTAREKLGSLGFRDIDNDGFLEYQNGGKTADFSLTFLVCSEHEIKVETANIIAESLRQLGIEVKMKELKYEEYVIALEGGAFDIYYGETALPPSLDFTGLLCSSLNYGGINNDGVKNLINSYLKSKTPEAEKAAASSICKYVFDNAPVIPVMYRQCYVHIDGAFFSFGPTQSGFFAASQIGKNLADSNSGFEPSPSGTPSPEPSAEPSEKPSEEPSEEPSPEPSEEPPEENEPEYTEPPEEPSEEPGEEPSEEPPPSQEPEGSGDEPEYSE